MGAGLGLELTQSCFNSVRSVLIAFWECCKRVSKWLAIGFLLSASLPPGINLLCYCDTVLHTMKDCRELQFFHTRSENGAIL